MEWEQAYLGDLLTIVLNHLLNGTILQVPVSYHEASCEPRHLMEQHSWEYKATFPMQQPPGNSRPSWGIPLVPMKHGHCLKALKLAKLVTLLGHQVRLRETDRHQTHFPFPLSDFPPSRKNGTSFDEQAPLVKLELWPNFDEFWGYKSLY